jgi:hypothetical protein
MDIWTVENGIVDYGWIFVKNIEKFDLKKKFGKI